MACPVRVGTRAKQLKYPFNRCVLQKYLNANNSQHTAADSDAQNNVPVELWRHGKHLLMQLQLFITGINLQKYLIIRLFY